ncbi:MAG: PEP/pyruvate-binding domain-containing protein [Planctomycetota bacterium]
MIVPFSDLRLDAAQMAGVKMATLGDVRAALGLAVPDGFVITTTALARILAGLELEERVNQLVERLRRRARLVAPLNLVDPSAPDFRPSACRSLHDVTRFVHEKIYEVMFGFGEAARRSAQLSLRLECDLPITVMLLDVGGGLLPGAGALGVVQVAEVSSVPMRAFLAGLTDPSIRGDRPRPISARGFLSVLGESMAGPPAEAQAIGGASFAVFSEPYMNFSTKAGYHYSTVDTYCGRVENKNYIHLRFAGGGAAEERRVRRVRFLEKVLQHFEFQVQIRGDILTTKLEKYNRDFLVPILVHLGRMTICLRQLDMLMDSESSPALFADAFLAGDMERFS